MDKTFLMIEYALYLRSVICKSLCFFGIINKLLYYCYKKLIGIHGIRYYQYKLYVYILYIFSAFVRPKVGKLHENSCLVRNI